MCVRATDKGKGGSIFHGIQYQAYLSALPQPWWKHNPGTNLLFIPPETVRTSQVWAHLQETPAQQISLGDQDLHAAPLEFLGVGVGDSIIGDEGMYQFQRAETGE